MSPSILRIRCPTEYFYLTGVSGSDVRRQIQFINKLFEVVA